MDETPPVNVSIPIRTERHGETARHRRVERLGNVPANSKLAYTIEEFVAASGLGRTSTYKLINANLLKIIKIGRRTLITAHSAHELLGGA
jgi:hypothetical protein